MLRFLMYEKGTQYSIKEIQILQMSAILVMSPRSPSRVAFCNKGHKRHLLISLQRPQVLTSLESLNYTPNTIKIPDGDTEVHNYTIPTNGIKAENSYANLNISDRVNEVTKEALTIIKKKQRELNPLLKTKEMNIFVLINKFTRAK